MGDLDSNMKVHFSSADTSSDLIVLFTKAGIGRILEGKDYGRLDVMFSEEQLDYQTWSM